MAELPVTSAAATLVSVTRRLPTSAALTTRLDSVVAIEAAGSIRPAPLLHLPYDGAVGWMDTPLGGAFVSLLLGLLLGLERERAKQAQPLFAGIRTLPMIPLCGFFAASAAQKGIPLALPALLLAVGAFGLVSYLRATEADAGITTEVAALVAALLGAVVAWGQVPVAASMAV